MAEQLIYQAINEVMEACGAVGKDMNNRQQGYNYRGIDDVMNALNPALKKAKVFASPEVLESTREERHTAKGGLLIYSIAKVKYTFYAADGSSVSAIVIGEGMDSGDKSMNKAMSAAYKYALFQVFCIPTEEMVDSEVDSPQPMPQRDGTITIDNPTEQDMARLAAETTAQQSTEQFRGSTKMIDNQQIARIQALANEKGVVGAEILKRYKVNSLSELTAAKAADCIKGLEATQPR